MARDINLGPTGGPFVNIQENNGDLDITGATDVDLNGAVLTNANGVATTNTDIENFSTSGSADTLPVSNGAGGLSMQSITEGFESVQVFEADGTFDATNVDKAFVECVGGGGGGGTTTISSDTDTAIASGGGGGNYAAGYVDISADSSISITVGTGGSAGNSGGTSSFSLDIEAEGGEAGENVDSSKTDPVSGGNHGLTSTGDITIEGQRGELGPGYFTTNLTPVIAPSGGSSVYGSGSTGMQVDGETGVGSFSALGRDGQFPGGGGMGGIAWDTFNSLDGDGADGVVIVHY